MTLQISDINKQYILIMKHIENNRIGGQNRLLFCPDELGGGLWPLIQGQRHSRWTLSMILATRDFAVNGSVKLSLGCPKKLLEMLDSGFLSELQCLPRVKRGVGEADSGLDIWERLLSHAGGDKMCFRPLGDISPMGELPCFRNFRLFCACRPEKLASTSLDAGISVGVHGWTLTPHRRPNIDANLAFGQNSKTCRKLCMPCIYTCNIWRGYRYCWDWRSTLSSLLKSWAIFDLVVAAPALQASTRYQPTLGTTMCLPAMGTLFLHTKGTYRRYLRAADCHGSLRCLVHRFLLVLLLESRCWPLLRSLLFLQILLHLSLLPAGSTEGLVQHAVAAVGEVHGLAVPGPVAPPARHVAARPHGLTLHHAYLSKPWL
ncbi:hypothetical protein Taro_021832 [Colocasia esculenta]|uniref:Uncharacterized protein n=1 Tax=Colocasia esculenta TaxID=4460 RepID=A0A843VCN8_COLES|nr:hypothetical protein [Colocasia esculenta]